MLLKALGSSIIRRSLVLERLFSAPNAATMVIKTERDPGKLCLAIFANDPAFGAKQWRLNVL